MKSQRNICTRKLATHFYKLSNALTVVNDRSVHVVLNILFVIPLIASASVIYKMVMIYMNVICYTLDRLNKCHM